MAPGNERLTLLDACAVINLYATQFMQEIVGSIDGRVGVVDIVARESLYVLSAAEAREPGERELIDLELAIDEGLLEIHSAENDSEFAMFIDYTVDLDDGEAMTLALARNRNGIVVTDDRKAIRLASSVVEVRSSLDVIKAWIDTEAIASSTQREVLVALQERASYVPGKSHSLRAWWDDVLDET